MMHPVATTDRRAGAERLLSSIAPPVLPTDHDLTLIIPALNEQERLPWTLCKLAAFLIDWGVDYRVVVADDGSTDATAGLADRIGPRFSTIRLPEHHGKGRAVRTAMLQATGRVVGFTDADLPFDLEALRRAYQWIRDGGCQVVFGARDVAEAGHVAPRRLARRIATRAFREVVKRLVSREVPDTQCGLKVFSRRAALDIFRQVTIDGFAFDAEVVYLTHHLGLPFRRVPVTLVNEYASTLSLRRHALPMLCEVLRVWLRGRLGRYRQAALPCEEPADDLHEDQRKLAA